MFYDIRRGVQGSENSGSDGANRAEKRASETATLGIATGVPSSVRDCSRRLRESAPTGLYINASEEEPSHGARRHFTALRQTFEAQVGSISLMLRLASRLRRRLSVSLALAKLVLPSRAESQSTPIICSRRRPSDKIARLARE